jgi:hypothetical protein
MNCYKFATVKAGNVTSGFEFQLTNLGTEDVYSVSISESSTLSLDLTYKDLCKISQGADPGKPWAIRGPYCDQYHRYSGSLAKGGFAGNPGDLGTYTPPFSAFNYNICLFFEFNLWGECPYERFDGRLNAYGRKAQAEAPPPDPENPQPCPTDVFFNLVGVPVGQTPDPENPSPDWINIPFSISTGLYNYGSANNEPYESTGTLVIYNFDEFGQEYGIPYEIKVTGTRNVQITEAWGE